MSELLYQIALTMIGGIGDVNAKSLIAYCGSASEVFTQKRGDLLRIPGIGEKLAKSICSSAALLKRAAEEEEFIYKHRIRPMFFTDSDYPTRLRYCIDAPVLLYFRGNGTLNAERIVAIVGTRTPSEYGIAKTIELVRDLSSAGVTVVSGLAYGVDAYAHKAAVDSGLQTIGVLGHGLDRIYPTEHTRLARKMIACGGLLTDFMSGTNPDAVNFPKRNRIVAGICDALVVIESRRTGGSLITATIASSYNRDVFAIPGRAGEPLSEGGNGLIKRNRAGLIESAEDLLEAMQWTDTALPKKKPAQLALALNLSEDERKIMDLLKAKSPLHVDEITYGAKLPVSRVSTLLLQLEFSNLVRSRPGKLYVPA
jgi:DNA processing protein